jgi:WD40 repeat protein
MQVLSIGRKKRIHAIAFSPSGRDLVAACGDGQLRVWELATGQVRHAIPIEESSAGYALAYLEEDRLIFAGAELRCLDVAAGRWHVIRSGMRWGPQVRVSPDGRYLAEVDQTASTDWHGAGLLLHETAGWKELADVPETDDTTGGLAFSHDSRWLATGHIVRVGEKRRHHQLVPGGFAVASYDYVVRLREMPSGRVVRAVAGWQQAVGRLAFSPSGTVLAGTAGPRLRIWDVDNDHEIALHKRGTKHFQGLSFTADGRYLATVSNDETVRIWDTLSWQEHTTFTWRIGKLLNIAFAPDGFRAAAGSDSGQIVIWDVDD